MKAQILTQAGEAKGEMILPPVFDVEVSAKTLTLYLNYLRAGARYPIANTLGRGEVSGGGRKPWKQKGTGNARVGSTRSPLWVGGGVTFGPSNQRNFRLMMNRRERRRAILGLFKQLSLENKLTVVEALSLEKIKTKEAVALISKLKAEGKIALISKKDQNITLSFRNVAGVFVMTPETLDFIYLLGCDRVIVSKEALLSLAEIYKLKEKRPQSEKEKNDE